MTTLVQLKHGYDQAGNRLFRRDEVARTNSASFDELYGYDSLNRLTSFNRGVLGTGNTSLSSGPTLNQGWTLDSLGNWNGFTQTVQNALTQTREHNEANEITDISRTVGTDWPTPVYDANGNTTSFPDPRSLSAELSATYDAWNRLVKLEDGGGTVAECKYDGLNRRIVKEASSVTRHYYHSDRWQVLEERTGSSTSADKQYMWGQRYVDDLILRDHSSTRLYALTDALFNVVALTDDDGAVVERFAYQPYGQSEPLDPDFTSYSGTDYKWDYRFTGRELDLESGLQLNRLRYLHLQLGRWINRDPLTRNDANLYQYCDSNPIISVDPDGLQTTFPQPIPIDWGPIIGGIIRIGGLPWWLIGYGGIAAIIAYLGWRLYRCLPEYSRCLNRLANGQDPSFLACTQAGRTRCLLFCADQGGMRKYDRGEALDCLTAANATKCALPLLACILGGSFIQPPVNCSPECDLVGCHCVGNLACDEEPDDSSDDPVCNSDCRGNTFDV